MEEINLSNNLVEVYNQPIQGRLFVVGDLHGSYALLMNKLDELEFNFQNDLLVSVAIISKCVLKEPLIQK